MELDVKAEIEKVTTEANQLQNQLNQVNQQIAMLQQQAQNLSANFLKKVGALEVLQNLDGEKPVVEE